MLFLSLRHFESALLTVTPSGNGHVYILVQEPIEKRCLHIHLVDVHLVLCGDGKDDADRRELDNRCKGLVEVLAWYLLEPTGYESGLVSFKIPMFIGLLDKHPAAGHYVLV